MLSPVYGDMHGFPPTILTTGTRDRSAPGYRARCRSKNRAISSNTAFVSGAVSSRMYLKDPMLSPVYGDMHGFPPTILTTGTRDLLLSNTRASRW
jgi:acetyl esterase/lipase